MKRGRPMFRDRICELNFIYGRGFMAGAIDSMDGEPLPKLRHVSRPQFIDQYRAGARAGDRFRRAIT